MGPSGIPSMGTSRTQHRDTGGGHGRGAPVGVDIGRAAAMHSAGGTSMLVAYEKLSIARRDDAPRGSPEQTVAVEPMILIVADRTEEHHQDRAKEEVGQVEEQ